MVLDLGKPNVFFSDFLFLLLFTVLYGAWESFTYHRERKALIPGWQGSFAFYLGFQARIVIYHFLVYSVGSVNYWKSIFYEFCLAPSTPAVNTESRESVEDRIDSVAAPVTIPRDAAKQSPPTYEIRRDGPC